MEKVITRFHFSPLGLWLYGFAQYQYYNKKNVKLQMCVCVEEGGGGGEMFNKK